MRINKTAVAQVRDWAMALVVIVWGGQAIYDRNFKKDEIKPDESKSIIQIFDSDGDGRLSDKETFEARQRIKALEE